MTEFKYFVGVDISSSTFTVSVGVAPWRLMVPPRDFENTEDGFQSFLAELQQKQMQPSETIICMEATGVYGEGLAYFAHAKGYPVAVQPPLEVKRAFKPNIRKTDAVDSSQIAEFACRFSDKLAFWQPRHAILEQIKVLLSMREQFVAQNTAQKNSLTALKRKPVKNPFAEQTHLDSIEHFKRQIHAIDQEIRRLIESDPTFKHMLTLLLSVPGVGLLLAAHMILLTQVSLQYKQLNSFLGIAPNEHSSGSSIHARPTSRHFGPPSIRKLLYLAACSVIAHHEQFKTYFYRKVKEGKNGRLILNNIENKLIKIMCAVLRTNTFFKPGYSAACLVPQKLLTEA